MPKVGRAFALFLLERKGCNLSGEEKLALAKETLLTEDVVEMWLQQSQHLSDVSTRRTESAKKAIATRRHKNKGHTEGVPRKYRSFVGNYVFCFCGQGEYGEMIACDSHIQYVQWSGSSSTVWGCLVLQRVNDFDKRCPFNGYLC